MAGFNTKKTIKTTNKEGRPAYEMTDKSKLVTQVLTSFFNEKKFYGDNSEEMQDTIKKVIKQDPEFVSNLAVFARKEFNMRSVSHVLTAYLAHEVEGKPLTRKTVKAVCLRGDDATEILACYLSTFGKPIPNALKKGLSDVLQTFDEYTLAKYKGDGKAVKMKDVLCLCRPTPKTAEQSDMWKRLIEGNLKTPMTWETQLSERGNTKEVWEDLIDSGKVGYMALLRNLRNIVNADPSNLNKVLDHIQDPEAVKNSKQLPFRFLSAYKELADSCGSEVLDALESAAEEACKNVPRLKGTTVIAVDVSGSMSDRVSAKSDIRCHQVATLLGLMANKICDNSYFFTFNNQIRKCRISRRTAILETAAKSPCGGGTDMFLPFEKMLKDHIRADRIIILSDNQCNFDYWPERTVQSIADEYRRKSGRNIWVHAIDLQGYGTQQFHGERTNIIAGWSEKVLKFIKLAEQGEGTLEKIIKEYRF